MISRTRALSAFSSAKEYASVQRAVIAAALPASNTTFGQLSENDRLYANSAQDSEASERTSFASIYGSGAEDLTKPIDQGNPTIQAADAYSNRVLGSTGGLNTQDKRSYKDWVDDDTAKIEQMSKIELTLLNQMEQKARELKNASQQEAIISGALILLVLGVSLVGAFVVARSMIRSLRRLQDTATKVAQDRLPELVKQLSESDPQDVDTSVESVGVHSRDEIGQVAAAFDDVHREAVRLAAEQALLRGNVNAMFTNLSRRSQGLIQRQLSLISELESREADPDQLSSLFKLDHLATACAVTVRTSSFSPVKSPAAAGPARSRWSTCSAPPPPRWSSTSASSWPRSRRRRSPAESSTTSCTCSPSSSRTPPRSPPRRPRSRSPVTRCPTAAC